MRDNGDPRPQLVERSRQKQSRQISAQMGLPGNHARLAADAQTRQAGHQIDPRPDQREKQDLPREDRRHPLFTGMRPGRLRRQQPQACRHQARYGARRPNHRYRRTPVEGQMGQRARHAAGQEEKQKQKSAEAPRHDGTESQQPEAVDDQVRGIVVQRHVADKGHQLRQPARQDRHYGWQGRRGCSGRE